MGARDGGELRTADISRGGVFVKTESPKAIRQLLRLKITFDPAKPPIEVHGMVVHATDPAQSTATGEPVGMGVEFIAFGGEPRERWEQFLRRLSLSPMQTQNAAPFVAGPSQPGPPHDSFAPAEPQFNETGQQYQSAEQPYQQQEYQQPIQQYSEQQYGQQQAFQQPVVQQPYQQQQPQQAYPQQEYQQPYQQAQQQSSAPSAYQHQPFDIQQFEDPYHQQAQQSPAPQQQTPRRNIVNTVFPIPVETPDQLYEIYERDLVAGVMFVCTTERLTIGDRVTMRIIHPTSRDEFDLNGKVQQLHDNPQYPGLSVALRPSTLAKREKFRAFIEAGLPVEDMSLDLIDE